MAHGIAQGILLSGKVCPGNVMVSAPSLKNLGKFKECGVRTTHCNTEVVQVSRVLFLAVKPRIIPSVLQEVSAVVTPQHIIVSVAAGVTVATLERLYFLGYLSSVLKCFFEKWTSETCVAKRKKLVQLYYGCGQ